MNYFSSKYTQVVFEKLGKEINPRSAKSWDFNNLDVRLSNGQFTPLNLHVAVHGLGMKEDEDFHKIRHHLFKGDTLVLLFELKLGVETTYNPTNVASGGFPCQPFSTLGKLQGFDDEEGRGTLFFEIKDIITKHKTKVVVLENVKNIMNHDKGKTFKRIIHELESLGYVCFYQILNSADYGVPQRRNRCYIVALLGEYFNTPDFVFPDKQKLTVTTQDLLDEDVQEKYFLTKKIYPTIMGYGTKNYIVKPTYDLPISKTLTATMAKMHRASQDNYVTDQKNYDKYCDDNRVNVRKLTPNECRKLQGFPSDWKQVVSDCQAYKQFGNAVTVNVSYNLARVLFEYIGQNKKENW